NEAHDQLVSGGEECRLLHAHADQIIDIEKAPVIDLIRCSSPMGQTIGKRLQQIVKTIETARLARLAVDGPERIVNVFSTARRPGGPLAEALASHFFFPLPLRLTVRIRLTNSGQMLQRRQHAEKLRKIGVVYALPNGRGSDFVRSRGLGVIGTRRCDLK